MNLQKHTDSRPSRWLSSLCAALCAVGFSAAAVAQAPLELTTRDAGQTRSFEMSPDEVYIAAMEERPAREFRQLVQSKLPDATVLESSSIRAHVKLARPLDRVRAANRTDDVSTALPTAEVLPVLYEKGRPRNRWSRRYATRDVLVELGAGKTVEALVAQVGATGFRATIKAGHVILSFASPLKALEAVKSLRELGLETTPLLQREMRRTAAAPADEFFKNQWHLVNSGQNGGTAGVDVNILGAWDVTLGAGTTIAVVDDSLETTHPDLAQNTPEIRSNLHYDFNSDDNNPAPLAGDFHGTAVGGIAAARQNNGNPDTITGSRRGISGAAPEAQLLGLRLISAPFTDEEAAAALFWRPGSTVVDVSNNSWGPNEGQGIVGPDILAKEALKRAALEGRDGLGQVTVFAAGNGLQLVDDANYDGFANSRYVLAVGALDNFGRQAGYSEPGANILVTAPGGGGTLHMVTTDVTGTNGTNPQDANNLPDTSYTNSLDGTSFSAPLVAGGAALMLSANPRLGWRDVKEILAATAVGGKTSIIGTNDADWFVNEAAFKFNHKYGGGMADFSAAVARAITWNNLGPEISQTFSLARAATGQPVPANGVPVNIPDRPGTLTRTFDTTAQPNLRLEHIEVVIDISHTHRSDLEIVLTSPSGKKSILSTLHPRPNPFFSLDSDVDYKDYIFGDSGAVRQPNSGWTFTTTHHWGENSQGTWTLTVRDQFSNTTGRLNAATLNFYGTAGPDGTPAPKGRIVLEQPIYSPNEGVGTQVIRVKRLGPLDEEATVDFETTVGSASAQSDYTAQEGSVHFSVGQAFADTTIDIPIMDDEVTEITETVNVVLNNPVGASLGRVTLAAINILDDEQNLVSIVAEDSDASENDQGESTDLGIFRVERVTAATTPLTVNYSIGGTAVMGTATGSDFGPIQTSVTIPAFEKSATITVTPRNDGLIEGSETIILSLVASPNYAIGEPDQATVRLIDNDRQKVQIFAVDNFAREPGPGVPVDNGRVRITRTDVDKSNLPLTINLEYRGTQENDGQDFERLPNQIIIPVGQESVDLEVVPIDNSAYQATKTVVVHLGPSVEYDFGFGFLTSARVTIREDDPVPDTRIPLVSIAQPANRARINAPAEIIASGSASDNQSVDRVAYRLNGSDWALATLTPSAGATVTWSVNLTNEVRRGENVLEVRSEDNANNNSRIAAVRFTSVELHQLNVAITGDGTVTPGFAPSSTREAGQRYTITATPSPGQIFNGWSSAFVNSISRTLTFTMPNADSTLTASFVANPFTPEVAGNYSGLVQGLPFAFDTSGFVRITVTPQGRFTGRLTFGGQIFPLRGELSGSGDFVGSIPRGRQTPLKVMLHVNVGASEARRVTGSIDTSTRFAEFSADRTVYSAANPAPAALQKYYTLLLPPAEPPANSTDPRGVGYGTMRIDAAGSVRWTGVLSDGTRVSQTSTLTASNTWSLYVDLYRRRGVILGTVSHSDQPGVSDFSAQVDWFKPVRSNDPLFPLGFLIDDADLIGSIYTAPAPGTRVLTAFDTAPENRGVATLEEGNLLSSIPKTFTLGTNNVVTITTPSEDRLALAINANRGTFRGSFIHPVSKRRTLLNGVIFQKQQSAFGLFRGSSLPGVKLQTGRIEIRPEESQPN